jgi:hypothetical protein
MHDIFKKRSVMIDIYAYCHLNCNISPERGGNYKLLVIIMQSLMGSCDSIVSVHWMIWGLNPWRGRVFSFLNCQTSSEAHAASCTLDTGVFPDHKEARA